MPFSQHEVHDTDMRLRQHCQHSCHTVMYKCMCAAQAALRHSLVDTAASRAIRLLLNQQYSFGAKWSRLRVVLADIFWLGNPGQL